MALAAPAAWTTPVATLIVSAALTLSSPALAQQAGALRGSATLGIRSVDVSGTESKFREDVNLEDGARLFDLSLSYVPPTGADSPVDELVFDARNLGGDPYETIHFGARRYGAFNLKLDRRRSDYFYADTILPSALASVDASNAGDFHRFDFERVRDTASLDIDLSPETRLSFGLEHQTREGESTTTLDIQRDEFELDKPLDETLDAFRFGVQHRFERITLIFEEELRTFENTSEMFLPGASPGENTDDAAELQFFMLDQSYDYDSRSHVVRVLADPTDRIDIRAMYRREDLDLDMQATEQSAGTDFTGVPFATDLAGTGATGRDIEIADIDFGIRLGERTRVVGGLRSSELDQTGTMTFGPEAGSGDWAIDTTGAEFGVEYAIRPGLLIAGGWSTEARDTTLDQRLDDELHAALVDTDRDGYFLRLLFSGEGGLELSASVEDNSIDDPYTLSSPTESQRYKISARRSWDNGLSVTGNYRLTDVENDASAWAADTGQTDLRIGYRTDSLDFSAGLGNVDVERSITQIVTGGFRQDTFPIAYTADSTFHDVSVQWSINDRASLGGRLRDYSNRGSYRLDRDDLELRFAYQLTSDYTLQLNYRDVDYTEDAFDAYDSEILELGIRLNWL